MDILTQIAAGAYARFTELAWPEKSLEIDFDRVSLRLRLSVKVKGRDFSTDMKFSPIYTQYPTAWKAGQDAILTMAHQLTIQGAGR